MTVTMPVRLLPFKRAIAGRRLFSQLSAKDAEALDTWIAHITTVERQTEDFCSQSKIRDLYCTLPTRATPASQKDLAPTATEDKTLGHGQPLHYGHSLAFFHPHTAEKDLRADGTDVDFCPPEPFTRRMWAGGAFRWHDTGLRIGHSAVAHARVTSVEKKGFDKGTPMVFVRQKILYRHHDMLGGDLFTEDRTHVYLPTGFGAEKRSVRELPELPKSDFSYSWTPTPTTLFRFSAMTFNAHHIHLDRDYAQKQEGYPERLVHGPLTALMLLEALVHEKPKLRLSNFEYRAVNPVIVSRRQTIRGAFDDSRRSATLWAVDDDGVIGMTGKVDITDPSLAA